MYNFDIDTKIDQTIAQNPTRDEKRSLKDSLGGTTMTDLAWNRPITIFLKSKTKYIIVGWQILNQKLKLKDKYLIIIIL